MTAVKHGLPPNQRRKYDAASKAEAPRPADGNRHTQVAAVLLGPYPEGISPKQHGRWQQAQLLAEVGSVEVARASEVHALRARLKRAEQEFGILRKPWSAPA